MPKKEFNLIIAGMGGQGIITLVDIITNAAFFDGYDVKSSELHGLSQRGGSVLTYIRFGEKIHSPLFGLGQADLIISTELLEGLRNTIFSNTKTNILINKFLSGLEGSPKEEEIINGLEKTPKDNLYLVPASEICLRKLGKEVVSGIFLLGCAIFENLIPLKPESILKAVEKVIPEKYLELNKKAFNLARDYDYD